MRRELPLPNTITRLLSAVYPPLAVKCYRAQIAMASASYVAAQGGTRLNRSRDTSNAGAEDRHLTDSTLWSLRETSREMDRNNGLTAGLFDRAVENIWGPNGFDLQPQTGSKDLDRWLIQDWNSWLTRADVRGEFNGSELIANGFRGQLVDGDSFCEWDAEHAGKDGGMFWIEGDRVLNPRGITPTPGEPIVNGIRFDSRGRKTSFFVANVKPNSQYTSVAQEQGSWRPADSIIQFYDPRRFSQSRGRPIVAPVIRDIDDLDDLLLYERVGAKLVAAHGFFVESDDPVDTAEALKSATDSTDYSQRIEEVTPGAIHYLKTGQKVQSVTSNRPSNNFEGFVKLLLRFVGLPLGFPYELVVLDFSQVNFASSRQLLNQAQRSFMCRQYRLGYRLSKIFAKWLKQRIAQGHYERQFSTQISSGAIYRQRWGFPGWPSPNPLQDAQASEIAIANRFGSRTSTNRRMGIDQEQIFNELDEEDRRVGAVTIATSATKQQSAQQLQQMAAALYEEASDSGNESLAEQAFQLSQLADRAAIEWAQHMEGDHAEDD